jgi:hypothetical protein
MILIPFEPKAGPIGGAGFACPPFTWSFTYVSISFAMIYLLSVICDQLSELF